MSSKTASARPGYDRASLYDEITGKIIAELEAGRGALGPSPGGRLRRRRRSPCRRTPATGRQYSGINVMILWGARDRARFPPPRAG